MQLLWGDMRRQAFCRSRCLGSYLGRGSRCGTMDLRPVPSLGFYSRPPAPRRPQPDPAVVGTEEYEANLAKCKEHLQVRYGGRVCGWYRGAARSVCLQAQVR